MADSDKNIIITPFRGATSQPQIRFVGQGNDPITLRVLDGVTGTGLTAGGALSIEGSAGQLFSVVNRLGTGSIFSVNDISGIPSIDVDASGLIELAPFSGNVGVGYTSDPGFKFAVRGGTAYFNNLAIFNSGISAAGSATFGSNIFASGSIVGNQAINAQTGTTYQLVLSDSGKLITLTNGSSISMTFPTNATENFPVGAVVYFAQLGAGTVGFTHASGVSLYFTPGRFLRTQYSTASATQIAANTWLLSGDLSA